MVLYGISRRICLLRVTYFLNSEQKPDLALKFVLLYDKKANAN